MGANGRAIIRVKRVRALVQVGLALALALVWLPARAGTVAQVSQGARALGLGGAFGAVTDDGLGVLWNPAGIVALGRQDLFGSHANLFQSDVRADVIGFASPFTRTDAFAVTWRHTGFDDEELGFAEDRVGLSYAHRLGRRVSLGVTGTATTQRTTLDGTRAGEGSGFGVDAGVLVEPRNGIRLGGAVWDGGGTWLRKDGRSAIAFPASYRASVALNPARALLLTADWDDTWHAGTEWKPVAPLALRAGLQRVPGDDLGMSWSGGLGLDWKALRIDYAYVTHPLLPATHQIGIAKSFHLRPRVITFAGWRPHEPVFVSLFGRPSQELGTIALRNESDAPVEASVDIEIPALNWRQHVGTFTFDPRRNEPIPVRVAFDPGLLRWRRDGTVDAVLTVSHSRPFTRTEKLHVPVMVWGRGQVRWASDARKACAFVTPTDPVVRALAERMVAAGAPATPAPNPLAGVRGVAAILEGMRQLHARYVEDPERPYATTFATEANDYVRYPREMLDRPYGDCDDHSVLVASLLMAVGIDARLVDTGDHLMVLAASGLAERDRVVLSVPDSLVVTTDEQVWLPIEATLASDGFFAAWRRGAAVLRERLRADSSRVRYIDVRAAQQEFPSAWPEDSRHSTPLVDASVIGRDVDGSLRDLDALQSDYHEAWVAAIAGAPAAGAEAAELERYRLLRGQCADLVFELERSATREPGSAALQNRLGVALTCLGRLSDARSRFETAATLDASQPLYWVNAGLVAMREGDEAGAKRAFERAGGLGASLESVASALQLGAPAIDARRAEAGSVGADAVRALLARGFGGPALAPPPESPRGFPGTDDLSRWLWWR